MGTRHQTFPLAANKFYEITVLDINNDYMESQRPYSVGKNFAEHIDVESHRKGDLHYVCISCGDNYYETDPYKEKSYALSEAKGYLEGIKMRLDIELQNIEKQLND